MKDWLKSDDDDFVDFVQTLLTLRPDDRFVSLLIPFFHFKYCYALLLLIVLFFFFFSLFIVGQQLRQLCSTNGCTKYTHQHKIIPCTLKYNIESNSCILFFMIEQGMNRKSIFIIKSESKSRISKHKRSTSNLQR